MMIQVSDSFISIDHFLQNDLFRTALDPHKLSNGYVCLPLITLREFTMQRIMNIITDKPSWHTKVSDEKVVSKWKEEFLNAKDIDVTQTMMNWCIEELRCKAEVFKKYGLITVYDGGVVKSDTAAPEELRQALLAAVKPLEDVPDKNKDWLPGTAEKVLDLVHPSLFPFVYHESRVLRGSLTNLDDCIHRCGEGDVLGGVFTSDRLVDEGVIANYSHRFQWLPCDVDISSDEVRIKSYINNLHPQKHKDMYVVIEQIIGHTIPLWNSTLSALNSIDSQVRRITYMEVEYDSENEEGDIRYLQPEPPVFDQDITVNVNVDLRSKYGKTGLQVIVKLANIHLTPNKPEYIDELWHVEGQMNEHICASAIYYYDSENITTSGLAFRQQSNDDEQSISYMDDDHGWLSEVFGCDQDGSTVQDVGSVNIMQGRLITFPNIFQHRVEQFRLQDPTKSGYCKVLSLFLVDPHVDILSTANVPCQRIDWWQEVVTEKVPQIRGLPREIQDHIFQFVSEFPMNMDDAMELKLELMDEREESAEGVDNAFHSVTFDLS